MDRMVLLDVPDQSIPVVLRFIRVIILILMVTTAVAAVFLCHWSDFELIIVVQ